jgi:hypothetical protein
MMSKLISMLFMILKDISFLFGCFGGGTIFVTLSYLFPAQETYLEKAILVHDPDDPDAMQITMDDKASDGESATVDKDKA